MSEYPYCQADATPKLDAEANAFGESKAENAPGLFEIIGEYKCKNRLLRTNIRLTFVQFGKDLRFKKGYYLTCDSHGDFKNDNINKKDALFYMRRPWIWCDECAALHFNQEGYIESDDTEYECPHCNGTGEVAGDYWSEDGMTSCLRCNGKGVL